MSKEVFKIFLSRISYRLKGQLSCLIFSCESNIMTSKINTPEVFNDSEPVDVVHVLILTKGGRLFERDN